MEGFFQSLQETHLAVTSRVTACLKALLEDGKEEEEEREVVR